MTTDNPPAAGLMALAESRRQVAIGLAVAGLVLAAVAVWWGVRGWPSRPEDPKAADVRPDGEPRPADTDKASAGTGYSEDYLTVAVAAGLLAVLCFGSAAWLATRPVAPGAEVTTVRTEVVTFGASAGLVIAVLGVALGVGWRHSLFQWVNEGQTKEARWVLIAGCVFTAGLIVMFASLQVGRAEERSNAMLRRALYGFNSVFLGLLLFLVLVAVNIVSFLQLPNTLVTNDSAFTELSEPSRTFLRSLDRPVHVYLIMPENYAQEVDTPAGSTAYTQMYSDCRGLLSQCESESPHFHASYLSPGLDAGRIAALRERFKVADKDRDQFGMWIAVGENEDVTSFVPARDLVDYAEQGRSLLFIFQGESKLINELIYLTDARSKDVVYVTQDFGELALEPGGERARKSMTSAAQYLRDKKVRIEPLNLDEKDPKVPDDAAVVLVPGPRQTIPADSPMYKALQEYMVPTKGGKPGKLLAYLPAFRGAGTKVAPSGLEPLLKQFGVDVSANQMVMTAPRVQPAVPGLGYIPADTMLGVPYEETGVSLERTLGQGQLLFQHARSVRPAGPGGAHRVSPLVGTIPYRPSPYLRGYWMEDDFAASAETTAQALAADPELRRNRLLTNSIPLAVAVTEGAGGGPQSRAPGKPRVIVYGSDTPLEDRPAFNAVSEPYRQLVLSDSLDWLREREANLGIPPKKESTYRVTKPASLQALLLLVGMVLMGIAALGVGVWLSRRR